MVLQAMKKRKRYERHGLSETPEYIAWACMIHRCHNPQNRRYASYGGRGITVCDRWRSSFLMFLRDVGKRPSEGMTLERVDNNGNYEPLNCRWASQQEQAYNRRDNRIVIIGGLARPISWWSKTAGIRGTTLSGRLKAGWSPERLLQPPDVHIQDHSRRLAKKKASQ